MRNGKWSVAHVSKIPKDRQPSLVFGSGPSVCENNAQVATENGLMSLAAVWELCKDILSDSVPLEIIGTRVSCGCVTVKPSKTVLQPKESATVSITMDARRFTGAKSVNIYVSVGPQYTSTATLQVTANSRTDVVFNPGQVTFPVVLTGQTPTQTIDIEYAGVLDWKISGIAEHSFPLTTKVEELYVQNPAFGFYFLKLSSARLFQNLGALEQRLAQQTAAVTAAPKPA